MTARRVLALAMVLAAATGSAHPVRAEAGLSGAATVHGCLPRAAVLLSPGAAPRRLLRLQLTRIAGRTSRTTRVEQVESTTTLANGSLQPRSSTRRVAGVFRPGAPAAGRLPYVAGLVVTFPGSAGAGSQTAGLHGFLDDRDGGAVGAQAASLAALPDELPEGAVGRGARWRVVLCSQIDSLHVQDTRTYTLGSFARGVVVASYRDLLMLDRGHLRLGAQGVNGSAVDYRLLTLGGTATGTLRLPLADAFAASSTTVSRLQFSFRDGSQPAGAGVIQTKLVDTRTDTPR